MDPSSASKVPKRGNLLASSDFLSAAVVRCALLCEQVKVCVPVFVLLNMPYPKVRGSRLAGGRTHASVRGLHTNKFWSTDRLSGIASLCISNFMLYMANHIQTLPGQEDWLFPRKSKSKRRIILGRLVVMLTARGCK